MSGFAEALEQARDAGDLFSGGTFSQETAAELDGSGLDLRDCRFQSCRFRDCDFSGAAPAASGTARTCGVPGGRTARWRRHCFVMSTLPAAYGSGFL